MWVRGPGNLAEEIWNWGVPVEEGCGVGVEEAVKVTLEAPAECLLCTNLLGCRELAMLTRRVVSSMGVHRHQLQGSGKPGNLPPSWPVKKRG